MIIRLGLLAVFLVFWMITLLPLKAVMIMAGGTNAFGYQDVYGTVWDGRIYGLRLGGDRVREIEISSRALPLIAGRVSVDWGVSDDTLRGQGQSAVSGDWLSAADVDLRVGFDRLGLGGYPGFTGDEMVRISVIELEMKGDQCIRAAGDVRSDAIVALAETYGYQGPVLEGVLLCDGDELVLDVFGSTDRIDLSGRVTFSRDGYAWQIEAHTDQSELAEAFALMGLERDGEVWRQSGRARYDG